MQREHPAAAALLRLSAVLPADDFPFELLTPDVAWPDRNLTELFAQPDALLREDAIFKKLRELDDHSLIEWNPQARTWSVHRLVQQVVRSSLTAPELTAWRTAAARAVVKAFAGADLITDPRTLAQGRRWYPSFRALRGEWENDEDTDCGTLGRAWSALGDFAMATGDTGLAKEAYQHEFRIAQRLAESDPANAAWQRDRSVSYWKLADLCERNTQAAEAQAWRRKAHDTLAAMEQRGIMQPIDAPYLETLRSKVAGT